MDNSKRRAPFIVVVDGIIGSGKTTLIETWTSGLTKRGWNVVPVKEPVEKWHDTGILKRFYSNPKRWGYHFQTKAFHDRVVENIVAYEKFGDKADVFILERSPFTDTLFMELLYEAGDVDDMEMKDYKEWWSLWYKVMPYHPNLFVYLKPDLSECMNRLRTRNRDGEQDISMDYQLNLERKHDQFFSGDSVDLSDGTRAKCIWIQTNADFKNDDLVKDTITSKLDDILSAEFKSV